VIGTYTTTVTKDIFTVSMYGKPSPVTNDVYAYVTLPGISISAMQENYSQIVGKLAVLENTPSLQAVYHTDLNILQAIFYDPGTVTVGGSINTPISVDKPCALLVSVDTKSRQYTIVVSNPSQSPATNVVNVVLEKVALTGSACVSAGGKTTVHFSLGSGEETGASMAITCKI